MTDQENQDILKEKLKNLKTDLIKANFAIISVLKDLDDIDIFADLIERIPRPLGREQRSCAKLCFAI